MRRHHYHAPHAMRLGLCGRLWRLGGFRYVLYTPFCGAQRPASPWPFREVRTSRSYSRRAGATISPLPASWNKCNPAGRNGRWAGVDGSIESSRRRRAFDSIARLRRVDCLYADSILLQIESIDCSYRVDRLDLEFIQRVSVSLSRLSVDSTAPASRTHSARVSALTDDSLRR